MTTASTDRLLAEAIAMQERDDDEKARKLLLRLHIEDPDNPAVNLQCAWIHDKLGLEAEAVPFYEEAIAGGLDDEDREDALLGLGSTYRALGRYDDALETLTRGVTEFPDNQGMAVFRAMALYNCGRAKEACQSLLGILAGAPTDSIARYRPAILAYAQDLDKTWQ